MTRTTLALTAALGLLAAPTFAAPAAAQPVTTGGAGNTGVAPPAGTGGVTGANPALGTTASPSNTPIPGTTPGVNIGGTPTSGPPGTGGTAGGPSLGVR